MVELKNQKSSKKFVASVIARKIVKTFLSNEKKLIKSTDFQKYYKQLILKKLAYLAKKNI